MDIANYWAVSIHGGQQYRMSYAEDCNRVASKWGLPVATAGRDDYTQTWLARVVVAWKDFASVSTTHEVCAPTWYEMRRRGGEHLLGLCVWDPPPICCQPM